MDQFFKELREIQKKERGNSSLARIRSDFYKRTYKYLDKLKTSIGTDPFSNEHYLLKDIQRIATEICERREHKITDAAVMNIQRSYHLFKGKPKFDLQDTTPLNLTKEEEKLYFSLIDTLKTHRHGISLDKLTEDLGNGSAKIKSEPKNALENNSQALNIANEETSNEKIANKKIANEEVSNGEIANKKIANEEVPNGKIANGTIEKNNALSNNKNEVNFEKTIKTDDESEDSSNDKVLKDNDLKNNYSNEKILRNNKISVEHSNDEVLNRLNEIKRAKVIKDENYENINEQLKKSQAINSKSTDFKENNDYENIKSPENDFNESTSFSEDKKIFNKTILIFSKVGAIVGVDEKIYGPFYPQDIVVMPNVNANIFIKNRKGRLVKI